MTPALCDITDTSWQRHLILKIVEVAYIKTRSFCSGLTEPSLSSTARNRTAVFWSEAIYLPSAGNACCTSFSQHRDVLMPIMHSRSSPMSTYRFCVCHVSISSIIPIVRKNNRSCILKRCDVCHLANLLWYHAGAFLASTIGRISAVTPLSMKKEWTCITRGLLGCLPLLVLNNTE